LPQLFDDLHFEDPFSPFQEQFHFVSILE
jgi:hypothetical protein